MTVVSLTLSAPGSGAGKLAGPDWPPLPLAAQYLATLLLLSPVARAMTRLGRRPVLAAGALLGMLGLRAGGAGDCPAAVCLVCGRQWFGGAFNAVAQYYRFVAADGARPTRARDCRHVDRRCAGGLAGPALASHTRLLGPQPFTVSFVLLAALAWLAALCALAMRIPPARCPPVAHAGPGAPCAQPTAVVGGAGRQQWLCADESADDRHAAGHALRQFDFAAAATVIQWHIVAMFAPSLLSGRLVQRLGRQGDAGRAVLMLASVGVSLRGETFGHFQWALALLGVGWNGVYVGPAAC